MKRVLTTLLKSVCIIALVLCGMDAQAQGNLVTGAVRDAKGEPVIGATVIVKGTATGATSGADGRYSIQAGPDATLEFSFIGYKKQEVPVGTRSVIDVVLEEDALMVDDVVVIGYGTQSRRTITAAVSKVDGEKLAGAPVNSIGDALKGRVGGVRVSSADNQPGSDPVFLIRGGSSINQSNAPIIIIDGVNREMTGLNPNDIESIEVLKDAASAGIYGARASNGVILITTKKGSMARGPQVTFEAQAAWTSPAVRFDLMNGGDYLRTMRTMLNEYPSTYAYGSGILTGANSAGIGNGDNSVWTPKFVDTPADVPAGWKVMVDPIDHSKLIAYQDNDQQKQWFDDSYWMNYYVGVNGGNDKVQYAASAGYTKDGGIGINTDFSRFTFHGNTSFKILRNLKATTVFDYSETKGNTLPSSGIATYWTTVGRGMFMPATHRDYLDDGTPAQGTNNTTISAAWFDRYYTSNYTARRMTANFNLEWEIVDGLRAVMQVANHNYYRIDNQRLAGNAISNQRRTYEKWGQTNRFSTQGYLNYRKTFAQDHTIEGTVGFDYMKNTVNGLSLTVTGADSDKVPTLAAGTDATGWADTNTNEALSSYFGRLNYDYKKKYLFMFTFRADGSSKFAEGNRWGYFPAASAGWVVSEEKFWNVRNFNSFKIRASYGLTGNNYIGLYDAYGGFGATSIYNGASAILPTALPNMRLKWETTHQLDIGVDMGFFNDRIRLMADYYNKKTTDMLMLVPESYAVTGEGQRWDNIGAMVNRGVEINVSGDVLRSKHFTWNLNANVSYNRNKLTELYGGVTEYVNSTTGLKYQVGHEVGEYFFNRFAGVNPANGDALWYTKEGEITTEYREEDKVMTGKSFNAPWMGGFGTTLAWKGLSLSAQFSWMADRWVFNNDRYFEENNGNYSGYNQSKRLLYDRWKQPGDVTDIPRYGVVAQQDDRFLENSSFMRLKNLTLSYSFPKALLQKTRFLSAVRIYLQGQNLLTFTDFTGLDPEYAGNVYLGQYPATRQYTLGIDITF